MRRWVAHPGVGRPYRWLSVALSVTIALAMFVALVVVSAGCGGESEEDRIARRTSEQLTREWGRIVSGEQP